MLNIYLLEYNKHKLLHVINITNSLLALRCGRNKVVFMRTIRFATKSFRNVGFLQR